MTATATLTRWWWVRHAPVVGHAGRIYGNLDVDCDCSDEALFRALAAGLPREAVWIVTPLARTRATAEAIRRHHDPPRAFLGRGRGAGGTPGRCLAYHPGQRPDWVNARRG